MRRRRVVFSDRAEHDLQEIGFWLSDQVSPDFSVAYLQRIRKRASSLRYAGERGSSRTIGKQQFRLIGLMGHISIAFFVDDDTVTIFKVIYGGQDWESALSDLWDDD
jgi:toxin ParE1/3/4